MNKITDALIFSFLITTMMVMLDALYHLGTETAVHINYMLVKITLIFSILFFTTLWSGKGKNQGIFVCITGPLIFYLYYIFADATLNRDLFTIDDSFGYIFLHIFAFALSYFLVYHFIDKKNGTKEIKSAIIAFILSLSVLSLDSFYRLGKVQLETNNEEIVVAVMSFGESLYLVLFLIVIYFLIFYYAKNRIIKTILFFSGTLLGIGLIGQEIPRTFIGIISGGIPYFLLLYYQSKKRSFTYKKHSYLFLITALICTVIGIIYTFLDYKIIAKIFYIGFSLQHNDHIIIGTIALTIAVSAWYAYFSKIQKK